MFSFFTQIVSFQTLVQLKTSVIIDFFSFCAETEKAANALNGRWFGGRVIKAEAYDELKFGAGELSG